jgi:hypothetical protein
MLKRGRGVLFFRLKKLRKDFDGKTQAVRGSLIAHLEDIEDFANERFRGVRGEKNKQRWARIAAYIAQTITYVAAEFDTSEVNRRLDQLERMVRELRSKKKA